MNQIQRIVKWAAIGAVVGFLFDFLVTSNQPTSVRVTLAFMLAGGGCVTAGLLAAVFLADEAHDEGVPRH